MHKKTVILVDIDNTLANINKELQKRGINTDVYPSPIPKGIWEDGTVFSEAEPIMPIIEKVQVLSTAVNGYVLCYFTSRPPETREITGKWLAEHVGIPNVPVFFTEGMPKGKAVSYFFGEKAIHKCHWVAFDDSPHEIMSYLSLGNSIKLFIPDWPYNRHISEGHRLEINNSYLAAVQ